MSTNWAEWADWETGPTYLTTSNLEAYSLINLTYTKIISTRYWNCSIYHIFGLLQTNVAFFLSDHRENLT